MLPGGLERMDMDTPPAEPVASIQRWLDEACEHADKPNPMAMTLATVDGGGQPTARMMLLKGIDERGAVFFTNLQSRKGDHLIGNPRVALLLHWDALGRQIRIEGTVAPVSDVEADAYFASRAYLSRIGAVASDQSRPLASRSDLEQRVAQVSADYPRDSTVPRPAHWAGLRVSLDRVEFWQQGEDRLHDRIVYWPDGDSWRVQRLWP